MSHLNTVDGPEQRTQSANSVSRALSDSQPQQINLQVAPKFDISHEKTVAHEKGTSTIAISHVLTHDPDSLIQYIGVQMDIVPHYAINIRGTHFKEYTQAATEEADFDFTISKKDRLFGRRFELVSNEQRSHRGTRTKTDGRKGDVEACHPPPTLEEWCYDFCAYRGGPKE